MTETGIFDDGFNEPTVPRLNGAPDFDAPWQARAHALAVLSVQGSGREWEDFRQHLIVAIDGDDQRPYWDSWVVALDAFLSECGLLA